MFFHIILDGLANWPKLAICMQRGCLGNNFMKMTHEITAAHVRHYSSFSLGDADSIGPNPHGGFVCPFVEIFDKI